MLEYCHCPAYAEPVQLDVRLVGRERRDVRGSAQVLTCLFFSGSQAAADGPFQNVRLAWKMAIRV